MENKKKYDNQAEENTNGEAASINELEGNEEIENRGDRLVDAVEICLRLNLYWRFIGMGKLC